MPKEKKGDKGKVIPIPGAGMDSLQTLASLISRGELLYKLGYQYEGDRDIYETLGYKNELEYSDYYAQYSRQDIAAAVIDRPVQATWRGGFWVIDSEDDQETELEKQFNELYKKHQLVSKFSRLDKLVGLGTYGVLLLGLSDVRTDLDMRQPVKGVKHELKYVRPFGESSAEIKEYVTDASDERYGKPLYYSIKVENLSSKTSATLEVHWTRVIHVAEGLLESEIEGTPRLQPVFNRLKDLEKIVGGSAEMFWRGARPGYHGKVPEGVSVSQDFLDTLQDQLNEYEHKLRRFLVSNLELNPLALQVSDPSKHVDVQIQMISSFTGIPKKVLTGTERGELASTEDKSSWFELIEARRNDFAEVSIVRPFVDRCIEFGILPAPTGDDKDYSIGWHDLWAASDKDKAEVALTLARAIKEFATQPLASEIIPVQAFLEYILNLDKPVLEVIIKMQEAAQKEEEEEMAKLEEEEARQAQEQQQQPPPPAPPGQTPPPATTPPQAALPPPQGG